MNSAPTKKIQVLKASLNSRASKHIAPVEFALDNVTEMKGNLVHNTDDDRIVLTASHAFYQSANSSECHEIARVIGGMYCMLPLEKIHDTARASSCQLLAAKGPSSLTIQRHPSVHKGNYRKMRLMCNSQDLEFAKSMNANY
ncbi:hypothetical protein HDU77_009486 [Chytriomyces hyalinus]|nr:hypothetical protein HDU77_009486 [Chytriomyces hyalinus]